MTSDQPPDSTEADRRLQQRLVRFLQQCGYGLHSALELCVGRGVVTVEGQVPTFYLRQIAVESIRRVSGVTQVVDRIQVVNLPRQRQASPPVENGQASSESSIDRRVDLQDTAHTGHDALHAHVGDRHPLPSARG